MALKDDGHGRAEAAVLDLPSTLQVLADRAADLLRSEPAPAAGKTAGYIECLSNGGEGVGGLVWFLGWMEPQLPLSAAVAAVTADGVEHPSSLVAVPHTAAEPTCRKAPSASSAS